MNIKETLIDVLKSILPITFIILILEFFFKTKEFLDIIVFLIGVLIVIIGFTLFLIGTKSSLLPLGELVGKTIISQAGLWSILLFGFILGFAVTMAEPGVQLLADHTDYVFGGFISKYLVLVVVSLGIGIFLVLSLLRSIFSIPLKYLLFSSYILVFILAYFSAPDFFPIAFDAGGVTTGPVTVPFIMALGVGITSIKGIKKTSDENFGFVGLASIGPILAVLLLGVIFK
ncbi:MAG: DUF1538 domain-containing protein [Bacilli bacterium]|jgi:hypothetical protein